MAETDVNRIVRDRVAEAVARIVGELALEGEPVRALTVAVTITTPTPIGRPNRVHRYTHEFTAK